MIRWVAVPSAFVFAITSFAAQGEAEKADLNQMQGKWEVVADIHEGKPKLLTENKKYAVWTISKHKIIYGPGREDTIRLDATKSPKTMDIDSLENGKVVKNVPAIYVLDGDTFILCVGIAGQARPTAFETKGTPGHRILVLRRVKE